MYVNIISVRFRPSTDPSDLGIIPADGQGSRAGIMIYLIQFLF